MNHKERMISQELQNGASWVNMQDALQNSVVQVVAQIAKIDWCEPYRLAKQYESRGSGFFIDTQGYVITNAHVVDQAAMVWINLPALGTLSLFADIVGFCPERDLALLKIRDQDLELLKNNLGTISPLPFGDSDSIKRTEQVLILGYPLGYASMKSSTGIVSGREYIDNRSFIQITAPINVGNSGGPLINAQGEVIGIALAKVVKAQNIGYAIPINEVKIMLDDLYKQPLVRKEMLGFQFNYASDAHAKLLGNPTPSGIYINQVFKNKFFDTLGVQAGDMLYRFNDLAIDAYGETIAPFSKEKVTIFDLASRLAIGDHVSALIYRNGKKVELTGIFQSTAPYPIRRMYPPFEQIDYEIIGGMVIMELIDNHFPLLAPSWPFLVEYTRDERRTTPVLVITHLFPGSLIYQTRSIVPGFIIKEINGIPVKTVVEFRKALLGAVQPDLIAIKTDDDITVVLPLRKTLEDERRLSKDFAYPLTHIVETLLNQYHE